MGWLERNIVDPAGKGISRLAKEGAQTSADAGLFGAIQNAKGTWATMAQHLSLFWQGLQALLKGDLQGFINNIKNEIKTDADASGSPLSPASGGKGGGGPRASFSLGTTADVAGATALGFGAGRVAATVPGTSSKLTQLGSGLLSRVIPGIATAAPEAPLSTTRTWMNRILGSTKLGKLMTLGTAAVGGTLALNAEEAHATPAEAKAAPAVPANLPHDAGTSVPAVQPEASFARSAHVVTNGIYKGAFNSVSSVLGAPADAFNWGLNKIGYGREKALLGSENINSTLTSLRDTYMRAVGTTAHTIKPQTGTEQVLDVAGQTAGNLLASGGLVASFRHALTRVSESVTALPSTLSKLTARQEQTATVGAYAPQIIAP